MIAWSLFPIGARWNAAAIPVTSKWDLFADWVATPHDTDDKHASAYSPLSAIRPGPGGRIDAGPAGFVVFEIDDAATPAVLERAIEQLRPFDAVIYTTASATADAPRFRAVVRSSMPISAESYASCVDEIGGDLPVAPESRQITRLWYRPITGGRMPPVVHRFAGGGAVDPVLAVLRHPAPPPPPRPPARTEAELAAWPLSVRFRQAWRAVLDRQPSPRAGERRSTPLFVAAAICHDYGLPHELACVILQTYARIRGWDEDDVEISDRVANAYLYARNPYGCALQLTSEQCPDLGARLQRLLETTSP